MCVLYQFMQCYYWGGIQVFVQYCYQFIEIDFGMMDFGVGGGECGVLYVIVYFWVWKDVRGCFC